MFDLYNITVATAAIAAEILDLFFEDSENKYLERFCGQTKKISFLI